MHAVEALNALLSVPVVHELLIFRLALLRPDWTPELNAKFPPRFKVQSVPRQMLTSNIPLRCACNTGIGQPSIPVSSLFLNRLYSTSQ